ncbi:SusC/RagA family TonB-linked outer membrane protein [Allomuricauda sp. ARW1Y1]|jgi:TonB-linked SusC/RagA family outer membrane protein|uniref:SusC/RagA family TonB-linked outer membrane protein n=1 Tax=Allomuricauda sp. ARW1Y1 TaxID=2663843 RepID=UPI0015C8791F|nr:SusC/RagA family TonB-linked outer membrane protein [Muricauda sp. ARW1Y1]NYJ27822.1 TonB-linked SusC/RagA family outer membrane protein [Muricauda sp. ARW1Y1]
MKKLSMIGKRTFLSLLFYVLLAPWSWGSVSAGTFLSVQDVVRGTVTDVDGNPLAGVNIVVESTERGTMSEWDGSFVIEAGSDEVLVFSMLGYAPLTVPVAGRNRIDVVMEEDVTALGEVVLNAGYYTVSERERTGNIATIKAEMMEKQPVGNPLAAIQGHLSGVNIVQNTGVPGGGFTIDIRGRNFINGVSDPLFIVDGVPISSQSLGSNDVSGQILGGNISPLNAINPNDIESIEVLKDADATAIYGSRGANGVVLITTKKGRAGETRLQVQMSSSLGRVTNFLELLNTQQYLELRREGVVNDGFGDFLENPAFDFAWPDIKTWDNDRYTDWQEELIGGTAYRNNLQLSVSGGSERTQFLISGSYLKETTVFPGDANYKKANVNSNISHQSDNGRFKINLSTIYTREDNLMPRSDLTNVAYTLEPNAPEIYDDEGNLNWEDNTFDNPFAALEERFGQASHTLISNALLSYGLLPDLEVRTSLGYNRYQLDSYRTLPSSAVNPGRGLTSQTYSSLTLNSADRESWIVEPQISWKPTWNKFDVEVLLGTTFQKETAQQFVQRGRGYPNDQLIRNLAAASTVEVLGDTDSEYAYTAVFGRVNVNFLDRYTLNLTGRRDGSSRFGPGRQFGNFGAVGLAWLFSEEKLFANSSWLSFGKLRGSYGTTGSDNIGDYRFLDTYDVTGFDYNGVSILEPTGIFNPLFGWESNTKLEVGLELGFFRDRVRLGTSFFRNRSSNQLIGIPLAATTGFSELTGNFDATVENTGVEVDVNAMMFQGKDFGWSTRFTLTVPKNKLVAFDGLEDSTFADRYIIGEPLTIVRLYESLGVDPETGIYQFEDFNGDGEITSLGDREWLEDLAPEFYGGFGQNIRWGNLGLDFFFQFKKQKAFNELRAFAVPGARRNLPIRLLDRWQEPGDEATVQLASAGLAPGEDTGALQSRSNAAVSDASFIRLRNITLNYRVPNLGDRLDINVYLQGQNLWTITNYTGPDPEQPSTIRLPQLRQLTLGLQLGF